MKYTRRLCDRSDAVLECVGTSDSLNSAIGICRPGFRVGFVGVHHHSAEMDFRRMFYQNIALQGGVVPVRAYIPELLADVLDGRLDPSPVPDLSVDFAGVPEGYRAIGYPRGDQYDGHGMTFD